jgi:hypothetical protein
MTSRSWPRKSTQHRRLGAHGIASLAAAALVALLSSGCAETVTGLSVAYARGNLETIVPADYETTRLAAASTLEEMDISLVRDEVKPAKAVLVGRNAQNQRVKILVRPRTVEASKVAIRVGSFGKHAAAYEVWQRLNSQLGAAPTSASDIANLEPIPPADRATVSRH